MLKIIIGFRIMSNFKNAIKASGLKIVELSRLTGASAKTISRTAVLGIKTARLAKRYAAVLGCDWKDLLD